MTRRIRTALFLSTPFLVLTSQAQAQDETPADDNQGLAEIIVTAQKREENL